MISMGRGSDHSRHGGGGVVSMGEGSGQHGGGVAVSMGRGRGQHGEGEGSAWRGGVISMGEGSGQHVQTSGTPPVNRQVLFCLDPALNL